MDEQWDSAASQSEDENHDNNHNEDPKEIESPDINTSKQLLLERMAMFKMIHQNGCADGKSSSGKSRIKSLNEFQTLLDKIGHKTSLEQHMISSTKIRWLIFEEDVE